MDKFRTEGRHSPEIQYLDELKSWKYLLTIKGHRGVADTKKIKDIVGIDVCIPENQMRLTEKHPSLELKRLIGRPSIDVVKHIQQRLVLGDMFVPTRRRCIQENINESDLLGVIPSLTFRAYHRSKQVKRHTTITNPNLLSKRPPELEINLGLGDIEAGTLRALIKKLSERKYFNTLALQSRVPIHMWQPSLAQDDTIYYSQNVSTLDNITNYAYSPNNLHLLFIDFTVLPLQKHYGKTINYLQYSKERLAMVLHPESGKPKERENIGGVFLRTEHGMHFICTTRLFTLNELTSIWTQIKRLNLINDPRECHQTADTPLNDFDPPRRLRTMPHFNHRKELLNLAECIEGSERNSSKLPIGNYYKLSAAEIVSEAKKLLEQLPQTQTEKRAKIKNALKNFE